MEPSLRASSRSFALLPIATSSRCKNVLAVDYHYGFHVNGTKWVGAGDNPDNTGLETGSNWELASFTD